MSIPSIQINPYYFVELGDMPFPSMMVRLFLDGGWIVILWVLIVGFWMLWVDSRQGKWASQQKFILLAIDVPRDNLQTPKAVEQIFTQISGAHSSIDMFEKYWVGKVPLSITFELVSIGGYVQFLVYTPMKFRDLVEASVYAQYPSAEIVEVQDYADKVPHQFPDPDWDVFGTEFVLKKPDYFPLRTYEQFEHSMAEDKFKDPMTGILESMSALKPGEQMWLQFRLTPVDDSWKKKGEEFAMKMLGKKVALKKGMIESALEMPMGLLNEAAIQLTGVDFAGGGVGDKKDDAPRMVAMSPGERNVLEAIQTKISKVGFKTKIRLVYIGRRDVFSKGRVSAVKGAMAQFGALDMNQFKGYGNVTPKSDYFYQRWSENEKKTKIVTAYRKRGGAGATGYILNAEELATIYHFPMMDVKAPLIAKTDAKRAEPPSRLPTPEYIAERPFEPIRPPAEEPTLKAAPDDDEDGAPPKNLPFA